MMNEGTFDVADCVARVRMHDQDAARLLVEYLQPLITRIVRNRLQGRGAEEDLVQEIFAKMFEKLNQYRGEAPLKNWVSRIAVNRCLKALRFQKVRPELRMADLTADEEAELEPTTAPGERSDAEDSKETRELLDKLLKTLAPKDRTLICMLEIEGLSIAEVQRATGWPATYIRVRAFRARRKLNKRFGQCRKQARQTL